MHAKKYDNRFKHCCYTYKSMNCFLYILSTISFKINLLYIYNEVNNLSEQINAVILCLEKMECPLNKIIPIWSLILS